MSVKDILRGGTDTISIQNMKVMGRIGVTPRERSKPQWLLISLVISTPLKRAGLSDQIKDTADYARIVKDIKKLIRHRPLSLIESLAESIAKMLLQAYAVPEVVVRVSKKPFSFIDSISVTVHRQKSDYAK